MIGNRVKQNALFFRTILEGIWRPKGLPEGCVLASDFRGSRGTALRRGPER